MPQQWEEQYSKQPSDEMGFIHDLPSWSDRHRIAERMCTRKCTTIVSGACGAGKTVLLATMAALLCYTQNKTAILVTNLREAAHSTYAAVQRHLPQVPVALLTGASNERARKCCLLICTAMCAAREEIQRLWSYIDIVIVDEIHSFDTGLMCVAHIAAAAGVASLWFCTATLPSWFDQAICGFRNLMYMSLGVSRYQLSIVAPNDPTMCATEEQAIDYAVKNLPEGMAVLHFLPTIQLVNTAAEKFQTLYPEDWTVLRAFAGSSDLKEVVDKTAHPVRRRYIPCTPCVENGLTIVRVGGVIDNGNHIVPTESGHIDVVHITQRMATQRAGRTARTADGFYIPLFTDNMLRVEDRIEKATLDVMTILLHFGCVEVAPFMIRTYDVGAWVKALLFWKLIAYEGGKLVLTPTGRDVIGERQTQQAGLSNSTKYVIYQLVQLRAPIATRTRVQDRFAKANKRIPPALFERLWNTTYSRFTHVYGQQTWDKFHTVPEMQWSLSKDLFERHGRQTVIDLRGSLMTRFTCGVCHGRILVNTDTYSPTGYSRWTCLWCADNGTNTYDLPNIARYWQ